MFGNVPPVGQRLRIGGMSFEVVGVQREKVQLSNYMGSDKESVFIPYTTAGQLWNTEYTTVMVYQAVDASKEEQATRHVKEALGKRLGFNPADERALRLFGSSQTAQITQGITLGLEARAGLHRRAHPGHRRHRRDEHHVRLGAPSGRARSASARRSARGAAPSCCSSCSRAWPRPWPAAPRVSWSRGCW